MRYIYFEMHEQNLMNKNYNLERKKI